MAGAAGNLGSKIVEELVKHGAAERALVREGKADGADTLRDLVAAGTVELVVGDLGDDPSFLAKHLAGVSVVVSAVHGGCDVIIIGLTNLL